MAHGKLKVAKAHTVVNLGEPSLARMGGRFQTNLHEDHLAEPLFGPQGPQIGDINQQAIGDCWYLSTIISILSCPFGSQWLEHALVDNRDHTVTVRLFDNAGTARYIRVRKSLAVGAAGMLDSARLYHSKGALWVAMLEKALTAFDHDGKFDPAHASYQRTASNDPAVAFRLLLNRGKDALLEETIDDPKKRQVKDYVLSFKPQKGWKASTQTDWQKLVAAHLKATKVLRMETFHRFMAKQDTSDVSAEEIRRVLSMAQMDLAGKRFTGQYPASHLRLSSMLEGCGLRQQPVVAYTRETVGRKQNFMGISSNEPVSKGLAGNHAYAVLGVVTEGTIQYVIFVNPWGRTGRGYSAQKKPIEIEPGRFRLELDDAVKRFRGFYATKALSRDDFENQLSADSGVPRPKKVEASRAVVPVRAAPVARVDIERPLLTEVRELRFALAGLMNLPSPEMEFEQARGYMKKWIVLNHPDKHQDASKEEQARRSEESRQVLELVQKWHQLRTSGVEAPKPVLAIEN